MKTLYKYHSFKEAMAACFLLLAVMLMTSCDKDGDKIYLSELETNELISTSDDVVLSQGNYNQQVLSMAWSTTALTVSNPEMSAPNIIATYMQVSTEEDFSSHVSESLEKNLSKVYTGSELNTIAKNLGMEPEVAMPLYFRLRSSVANNMEPVFSNVVVVDVTPYKIDMSISFILDSKKLETGRTLYSPASDGVYTGFIGAVAWYNFYTKEGDGTLWGNVPVSGEDFLLSSEESMWNSWFPGQTGCYYMNMDVNKKQWTALLLPTLSVSGDIQGEMTFDRSAVKWTYVFNASATGTVNVKLSTTGKQYNYATRTDDNAAVSTPVAFVQQGGNVVLAQQATDITVSIPATGECTLVLDLSDPKGWKCEVVSGSSGPVVVNPYLYVPGIDDGSSGSWNFNNFLNLYNEDDLAYAGVINVNSLWGYSFNTEKDNWDDKYTFGSGDAYAGTLEFKGSTNIPAPTPGLYLFDVSVKGLAYSLSGVGSAIYVSGLNDLWDFSTMLPVTGVVGTYKGPITISSASSWGFQIHTDTSWNHYFGGSGGKLYYKGSNITDDASLTPGTYQLTVDLINGTYSISN